MVSQENSPYAPPSALDNEPQVDAPNSKWIPLIGFVFSLPLLLTGAFGIYEEFSNLGQKPTQDFIFGVLLALSFLIASIITFCVPYSSRKMFGFLWRTIFLRLFLVSVQASIPFMLSILYLAFKRADFSLNLFEIVLLDIVARGLPVLFLSLLFLIYYFLIFVIARYCLKRSLKKII